MAPAYSHEANVQSQIRARTQFPRRVGGAYHWRMEHPPDPASSPAAGPPLIHRHICDCGVCFECDSGDCRARDWGWCPACKGEMDAGFKRAKLLDRLDRLDRRRRH